MRVVIISTMAVLIAVDVGCARHPKPASDPEQQRTERLAKRAFGVPQTDGYAYAFATGDCAPNDGPAVSLYLLDARSDSMPPKGRYLRVTIYPDLRVTIYPDYRDRVDSLAHQSFRWQESRGPGVAVLCSEGSCASMNQGQIVFGAVKRGSWLEGQLDLQFTNGIRIRRTFHANWQAKSVVVCG